jgi:hypothetical protein
MRVHVESLLFVEYSFNKITFFFEMQWFARFVFFPYSNPTALPGEILPVFPQLRPAVRTGPHHQTG